MRYRDGREQDRQDTRSRQREGESRGGRDEQPREPEAVPRRLEQADEAGGEQPRTPREDGREVPAEEGRGNEAGDEQPRAPGEPSVGDVGG
jgi:hypothetical protein